MLKVRPAVEMFAKNMENQLIANNHKEGWSSDSPGDFIPQLYDRLNRLDELMHELVILGYLTETGVVIKPIDSTARTLLQKYTADLGNYAMMLADTAQVLTTETKIIGHTP